MSEIILTTEIKAPVERCFNLALDIDVHRLSMKKTNEKAIAGRTSGVCELNDEITWQATHFGVRQKLTSKITKLNRPYFFEDFMLKGAFKSMRHEHHFEEKNGTTFMKDVFVYSVPFGLIGKLFDLLVLKRYMTRFLLQRNKVLKEVAENSAPPN